jgi:uncharacterized protein (DUF1499 family)
VFAVEISEEGKQMKLITSFRVLVLLTAVVAALLLLGAPLGYRLGWWHFRTGLTGLQPWAAYVGLAAAALAIIALAIPKVRAGWALGLVAALAVGLATFYVPWQWQQRAKSVPRIHDISTDTVNPPLFVAVLPLREGAENTAAYGGKEVAEQQLKAYPDIKSLELTVPPQVAFARALDAVESMGWTMVASNGAEGRIEATDKTLWYGFKDDVVVRVTPSGSGSKVDVRSVSRVGRSDIGINAQRIRQYLAKLKT